MRYFLVFASFILSEAVLPTASLNDPYKLTAVSARSVAQALYRKIKSTGRVPNTSTTIDGNTKNRICHHILNSGLYRDAFPKCRPYVSETYAKWKEADASTNTFNELFEESAHPVLGKGTVFSSRTITRFVTHDNTPTTDQGRSEENMFLCLTLDYETGKKAIVYYVSEEYNMSETPDANVAGRFIFTYRHGGRSDIHRVDAIAEEPARVSSSITDENVERYYLENRKGKKPAVQPSDDPICSLSAEERLHACAIVLSSRHFEGELEFVPLGAFVDLTKCEKREISFRHDRIKSESDDEEYYEEWMIACRPKVHHSTFQEEYFLSRVYDSANEVFALRWDTGSRIVIENVFENVRLKI